jgi:hypothetical protein
MTTAPTPYRQENVSIGQISFLYVSSHDVPLDV